MAEPAETLTTDASGARPPGPDKALAAAALGLIRRSRTAKPDERLDAFLEKQTRLTDLQIEHMHEQQELTISRLRWGRFSDRAKAALQVLIAAVAAALAVGFGVMVWQARNDHSLVVQAFSVPPDLAQRGLTGQVVATHVLDRLAKLQAQTITDRPSSSYANAWDDDVKVEIPDTGVSIGELNRFLRQWLGGETRVSGEIVHTSAGLEITARAGAAQAQSLQGPEADLASLIQRSAEAVYAATQPYRWAVYLQSQGRLDEALKAYASLAARGSKEDRPWAYDGWASLLYQQGDIAGADAKARESLLLFGPNKGAYANLMPTEGVLEHFQHAYEAAEGRLKFPTGKSEVLSTQALAAFFKGDFRTAADIYAKPGWSMFLEGQAEGFDPHLLRMRAEAYDHDIAAARSVDHAPGNPRMVEYVAAGRFAIDSDLQDWPAAARDMQAIEAGLDPKVPRQALTLERTVWPRLALAYARLGRQADADRLIALTPLDCDVCVLARALIATSRQDWAGMDRWFAEAVRHMSSLGYANARWGQALLAKGDIDGAIAKLKAANQQGPAFADPLEFWGEALIRRADYTGAVAKFKAADPHAPNWGRNHLMWGQALLLSGRYAEARRQFETASGLDLSAPDRAAVNVLLARTASGPLHG